MRTDKKAGPRAGTKADLAARLKAAQKRETALIKAVAEERRFAAEARETFQAELRKADGNAVRAETEAKRLAAAMDKAFAFEKGLAALLSYLEAAFTNPSGWRPNVTLCLVAKGTAEPFGIWVSRFDGHNNRDLLFRCRGGSPRECLRKAAAHFLEAQAAQAPLASAAKDL